MISNALKLYQLPGYGFPGLHAESLQTARMSEAFLECGVNASVVYPWSSKKIAWSSVRETYGLHRGLKRRILPGVFLTSSYLRLISNPLLRFSLALSAITSDGDSVFIGRHPQLEPLKTLIWLKKRKLLQARIFVELHEPHHYLPKMDKHIRGYIVISESLECFLLQAGIEPGRIVLAPNAVDLHAYELAHREQLTTQATKGHSVICYTGQMGPGRNVETLVQAMQCLEESVSLLLVGGRSSLDVCRIQEFAASNGLSHRINVTGQQPAKSVIAFQLTADVLVIPYTSKLAHARWCSPLKLWEYLASGKPIVAFPIPALREILRDDEVVWAKEETASALAAAMKEALTRTPRNFDEVRARLGDWTWKDRARRILNFIETTAGSCTVRAQSEVTAS